LAAVRVAHGGEAVLLVLGPGAGLGWAASWLRDGRVVEVRPCRPDGYPTGRRP